MLKEDWHSIRDGLEVKFLTLPKADSDELQVSAPKVSGKPYERFILCRSCERSKKEEGITQRFEKKIVDPAGLLTLLPGSDNVLKLHVGNSQTWSTVTPLILPGYDDPDHLRRKLKAGVDAETQKRCLQKLEARIDGLLRKAFLQAGYSKERVSQLQLQWRDVGFRSGVEPAYRYLPSENLNKSPRYHVKVQFPSAVSGPVAIGGGRFRGFGLMAIHNDALEE